MNAGEIEEAQRLFETVITIDSTNMDARILFGISFTIKKDLKMARKTLEKALQGVDSRDPYALCMVGNLHLSFARSSDPSKVRILFSKDI
jgi:cytochrome c-type biogenesis protein CcmH/NrfG